MNSRLYFLTIGYALLAPVAVYASRWTVWLMMILALAAWPGSSVFRLSLRNLFTHLLGLGLLVFILWSLLACLWSVNLWSSLLEVFKVALVTGFGLILVLGLRKQCEDEKVRCWIQSGMVMGASGIALIFIFKIISIATDESWRELLNEDFINHHLHRFNHASVIFALLMAPTIAMVLGYSKGRWYYVLPVLGGAPILIKLIPMDAVGLALVIGSVIALGTMFSPRILPRLLVGGFIFTILVLPWAVTEVVTPSKIAAQNIMLEGSHMHRLLIWQFTAKRALQQPFLGHGFDSAEQLGRNPDSIVSYKAHATDEGFSHLSAPPHHSHNAAIQIWYELGLIGVGGLLILVIGAVKIVLRYPQNRLHIASAMGLMAVVCTFGMVSFGIWQKWWLASLWLTLGAYVTLIPKQPNWAERRTSEG